MTLRNAGETAVQAPATTPPKWYIRGYFIVLLLIGLFIYKDYGVSWDESIDRVNGMVNAKYVAELVAPEWAANQAIFTGVPEFFSHDEVDHGALFHLPLAFIEVFSGGIDSRTYYLIRHFCIFLSFVAGAWALYNIGRIRFRSWQLGLLASTLLVLSPRIFADAFYNGKDLVFMAYFTLGVYTLVRLLERPTLGRAVAHGLATAVATDIRILGCLLVPLTLGMFILEGLFADREQGRPARLLQLVGAYCLATCLFTIAGWPYLWVKPFESFLQAFDNMKRFRWEGSMLYWGEVVAGTDLPWHYVPVWIIISTPVAYMVAFGGGALAYVVTLLRRPLALLRTFEGRLDLLFSGWLILPILMIIVLHSVIYDGWRHLYFVYPALLLLAVRGAQAAWVFSRPYPLACRAVLGLGLLAGLEGCYTAGRMVASHPHQQVYFSFLPAESAERLFERDYWGLSFRAGLQWVVDHDSAASIPVDCGMFTILLENNMAILKPEDRARLRIARDDPNAYYFATYRTHPEPYPESQRGEVYTLRANGIKILSIFHRW
jgi:hypothetical protein